MECPACSEQMTSLMDEELSALEAQPVEEHLRDCPKCRTEYESLSFSYRLVLGITEDGLQPPRWGTIENRIQTGRTPWTDPWLKLFPANWMPVAATAALVVVCVVLLMPSRPAVDAETSRLFAGFISEREREDALLETVWGLVDEGDLPNPFTLVSAKPHQNPFQSE